MTSTKLKDDLNNNEAGSTTLLRTIDDLPGPSALPLIGSLHHIELQHIHQNIEEMCATYGNFYRLLLGRKKLLIVADSAAITDILRNRPNSFRRPSMLANVSAEIGGIPGVFFAEGQDWRIQRKMVMHGMAPQTVKNYFPSMVRVISRLQTRWNKAADSNQPIDLLDDLKRLSVDVIAGLAFGVDVNTVGAQDNQIQHFIDTLLPVVRRRSLAPFPYWRYFTIPSEREIKSSIKGLTEAIYAMIAAARERMQDNPALFEKPANVLEAMLAAAKEEGSAISDETIAGNVSTLLIAGEDTSAHTIAWILYYLFQNPETLTRAKDEVRRFNTDPVAFTVDHLDSLDYLEACLLEGMRLKPVVPFMTLEALSDTVVHDIKVPAGTVLWCVLRRDSISTQLAQDALAFNPQRWLDDSSIDEKAHQLKRSSLPFGAGPRACPGRYLAMLEMKSALAMLLGNFDILNVKSPNDLPPKEIMGFVMSPLGLSMQIRRAPTS
jgi:cytochrome P450